MSERRTRTLPRGYAWYVGSPRSIQRSKVRRLTPADLAPCFFGINNGDGYELAFKGHHPSTGQQRATGGCLDTTYNVIYLIP